MGLLDEAIRDHLDLKRRRGADPVEVAREQKEALETPPEAAGDPHDAPDLESAQETAELDMQTVLEIHVDQPSAPVALGHSEANEPHPQDGAAGDAGDAAEGLQPSGEQPL